MTKIFVVGNQKGGTGKTTTAVTLSHGLALAGYRVLLIDLDSQGNVADCLGLASGSELADLLKAYDPELRNISLAPTITASGRNSLDVIRSDKYTANAKVGLASIPFKERTLKKIFSNATDADYKEPVQPAEKHNLACFGGLPVPDCCGYVFVAIAAVGEFYKSG